MAQPTTKIKIPYKPRACQLEMHNGMESCRWSVIVAHRRCGKTVSVINHLIKQACLCKRDKPRYAYLAPLYSQAKTVAWDYLKHFTAPIPGVKRNESELWVELPNGARIRLFGADSPDSLRGMYIDGVVMDEVAQMKPEIWDEIIRPALSDREGWAVFIGTPHGQNLFSELHQRATNDPTWYVGVFPVQSTDALSPSEVDDARKNMSEMAYRREYECDFSADTAESLISYASVNAALGRVIHVSEYRHAPIVLGVDVARFGEDRTVFVVRQGLAVLTLEGVHGRDTMWTASRAAQLSDQYQCDAIFIDDTGVGGGVTDRLRQLRYSPIPVNAGDKATEAAKYYNKRAEIWDKLREWIEAGGCLPNDAALRADLLGPRYSYDVKSRLQLEKKEDMKKRGLASPDAAESIALTFAQPIHESRPDEDEDDHPRHSRGASPVGGY